MLLMLLMLLSMRPLQAQQAGIIQGLQLPAWIEHQGSSAPLNPGVRVYSGDRLKTGAGARILLQLEEGSFVKLGENSELEVRDVVPAFSSNGVFGGHLDVAKGTFRYTTTLLSNQRKRDLSIRIAAVTASVRGTDLWAKAAADTDTLCLINGDISVQREGEESFRMHQPLSVYIAPKGAPAKPVAAVEPEQFRRWAQEVELNIDDGALTGSGSWKLNITSLLDHSLALQRQQEMQSAGYPVVVKVVNIKGKRWSRIMIRGFARFNGAQAVANTLEEKFGIKDAWITEN